MLPDSPIAKLVGSTSDIAKVTGGVYLLSRVGACLMLYRQKYSPWLQGVYKLSVETMVKLPWASWVQDWALNIDLDKTRGTGRP